MIKRNTLLLSLSILVGPGIGGVTFLVLSIIVDAAIGENSMAFAGSYWPVALIGGYVLGAVPGLLSGIAMIVLSNVIARPALRLAIAPLVGGVISLGCILAMLFGTIDRAFAEPMVPVIIAVTGAVAAFACMAIVEARHPLPALEA